jgi:hypothetical protein
MQIHAEISRPEVIAKAITAVINALDLARRDGGRLDPGRPLAAAGGKPIFSDS